MLNINVIKKAMIFGIELAKALGLPFTENYGFDYACKMFYVLFVLYYIAVCTMTRKICSHKDINDLNQCSIVCE
jgi:hypothetical protein